MKHHIFNFLWKSFVWIDYTLRRQRFPKSIELLPHRKDVIIINGLKCGFYSKIFAHYEDLSDLN